MKKTTSTLLVIAILLSLVSTGFSVEVRPGETFYGISTYRDLYQKIRFTDIDEHWAKDSIHRMSALSIIKGVGEGFSPYDPLTRDQAIALLIRLMGLEDEAQKAGEDTIDNEDTGGYIVMKHFDYWARGYIQEALNRNIVTQEEINNINTLTPEEEDELEYEIAEAYEVYLDDEDLTYDQLDVIYAELEEMVTNKYTWQKPVSREQVALWVSRALNLEPIYGKDQHKIYSLKDYQNIKTKNIPVIEAILQRGIMSGNAQGYFNPNSTMTRGEMAKLLDNIHESFLKDRGYTVGTGLVEKVQTATLKIDGEEINERTLIINSNDNILINVIAQESENPQLDKGFVVIKNEKVALPESINSQDYVRYYMSPENESVLIEVLDKHSFQIEGFIEEVDKDNNSITIIDYNDEIYEYNLAAGVTVKINGITSSIDDLIYGIEVILDITDGNVVSIRGDLETGEGGYIPPSGRIYIGKVLETSLENNTLIIMEEDEKLEFQISPVTSIIKDGQYLSLRNIKEGDMVRLEFDAYNENLPSKVYIASPDRQIENFIKARLNGYNQSRNEILLTDISYLDYSQWGSKRDDMKMSLSGDADIYFNGKKISKYELKNYEGYELYIATSDKYDNEEAVKLLFKDNYEKKFYNKLQRITYGDNTIRVDYNNMSFDESTIIEKDGRIIHPYNLRLDEEVFVITQGDKNNVSFISVEAPNKMAAVVYRGEIDDVYHYAFDMIDYKKLENNIWYKDKNQIKLEISEETSIIDTREDESVEISVETFNNSRFYTGDNTSLDNDHEDDNFRGEKVYVVEYDNMVSAIDIVSDFNGEEIITSAKVESTDLENNTIAIKELKDWSDFREKWNINTAKFDLHVDNAIIIKNGKRTTLDNISQDDNLYIIRSNNVGHIVIAE